MINEDVLGGIISALERGQSLKRAMMTLFNAGYSRQEIEEAARSLMVTNSDIQNQLLELSENNSGTANIKRLNSTSSPSNLQIKKIPKQAEAKTSKEKPASKPLETELDVEKSFSELEAGRAQPEEIQKQNEREQQKFMAVKQQVRGGRLVQKVSNYGEDPMEKTRERAILFVLFFLLLLLSGLLVMIFMFKDQLINFLSTFFG